MKLADVKRAIERRKLLDGCKILAQRVQVFDPRWFAAAQERLRQSNVELNFAAQHAHPLYDRSTDRLFPNTSSDLPVDDFGYWRRTLRDHLAVHGCDPARHPERARQLTELHRQHVAQAITRGEDVPHEVLDDHPDLVGEHQAKRHDLDDARRRMATHGPQHFDAGEPSAFPKMTFAGLLSRLAEGTG